MNKVIDFINSYQKFALVSHKNPDGDTLGSAFAMFEALSQLGKDCTIYCKSKPTAYYDFIENIDSIKPLEELSKGSDVICLDCADLERAGLDNKEDYNILSIDHHISNDYFGNVNYVCDASATAILVYDIISELKVELTPKIASYLYIGICTDTNNFTNSNVNSKTFAVASALAQTGIDISWLTKNLFRTRSLAKTKGIAKFIDQMEFFYDDKLCFSHLSFEQLEELELVDVEGLVNYASDVIGVSVAIFMKESKPGICKFSLRSNFDVDVRKICEV